MTHEAALRRDLEAALGVGIRSMRAQAGGDIHAAYRVELADGRVAFVKSHADTPRRAQRLRAGAAGDVQDAGALVDSRRVEQLLGRVPQTRAALCRLAAAAAGTSAGTAACARAVTRARAAAVAIVEWASISARMAAEPDSGHPRPARGDGVRDHRCAAR